MRLPTEPMVDYSNIPRDSRRVPIETRVQFKFDRFSGFISEYSANVSPGGMFISTRAPQPPGTLLDLEFRLGDGFELIRGRGEVVWNRAQDEGPGRPGGMGLRFLELSEESQDLIYRIVDQHILHGGIPFDVTQRPPDLTPAPAVAAPGVATPRPAPPAAAPSFLPAPFELQPGPAAVRREPEPPLDALSSWLPPLDRPNPEPPPAPDPLSATGSRLAKEKPVLPSAPMFSGTFGSAAVRPPRRVLPWVLLAAGLALAAGALLLGDRLPRWIGLEANGANEAASPSPPPSRPASAAAVQPSSPGPPQSGAAVAVPPPAASTAAPPAVAQPDIGPALTQLDRITWEAAFGGTDIVLWGNGAIGPEAFTRSRLGGNPPRELIRLTGIRHGFAPTRVVVGTPDVLQVRVGYHPEMGQGELHVVLDLAHPSVAVTGVEPRPHQLRLHLQRR